MLLDIDDSQVQSAERKLHHDRLALAEATRALREQCRRTLTRPSTLALLLVVGGLTGARAKTRARAPGTRRISSALGAMLRGVLAPLLKGVAALAVEHVLHRRHDAPAPTPQNEQAG
ncbi:MAG: hypothetical protein ABI900_05590 [Betaproteobacteria bacterium]